MALAAIDPWAADFESLDGNDDLRLEALEQFCELVDNHPDLVPLRFIDGSFWVRYSELYARLLVEDPRAAERLFPVHGCARVLRSLQCDSPNAEERTSLTMSWLLEVCAAIRPDDGRDWRDPVVFVPRVRQGVWLIQDGEIAIEPKGVRRLVVTLETPEDNPLYRRDFDPWLCEQARQTNEDRASRDLPRPIACEGLPMARWEPALRAHLDQVGPEETHLAFLPAHDWRAEDVNKQDWRQCPFGPHVEKIVPRRGRKSGPADRRGRIWAWDDATHRTHWDVQHESAHDSRYMNVRPDGLIADHY